MATDPEIRRQLAQQGRLWLLALICATAGALVVWRTNSLVPGVIAFLATVAVLGSTALDVRALPQAPQAPLSSSPTRHICSDTPPKVPKK